MESSHQKFTLTRPTTINTDGEMSPSRGIGTLQSWIKDKLDTIPSRYSEYDEGMKIITDAVRQEFAPRHEAVVMLALSKEFYTMGVSTTDTRAEIWSRWRYKSQKQIPGESSTTGDSRSKSPLAVQEKPEDENSESNSDGVSQVLPDSDPNYWGDLIPPAWPQRHARAKVVYIRPRSPKLTNGSGDEAPSDSRLIEHGDGLKSPQTNSSASLRASPTNNFNREESFENDSTLTIPHGDLESIMATKDNETKLASAYFKRIMTSSKDISSLGHTYPDSNGPSLGPFLPKDTAISRSFSSSPGDINPTSGYQISSQRSGTHKHSTNKKKNEIHYGRLPDIPVDTVNNGANPKNSDVQRGNHISSNSAEFETYSTHQKYTENNWPIQETREEYDTLAGNSVAPNNHFPDTPDRRSKREASPSSVYSFIPNSAYNDPDVSNDMQSKENLPEDYPDYDPGNPYYSTFHTYQPEKGILRPKQPKDISDNLAWRNKHIGEGRKSFQTRQSHHGENSHKFKSRDKIGGDSVDQGATTKFSDSTQAGFTVTKEVIQEEEIDTLGRFNRPTFVAHIPPFGKDSMEEIQKIHAKGDSRPAFLKSFRGAVHDGINMTWKGPTKSQRNNSKPPSKPRTRPIEKNSISGPMHDGNPLQLSGSRSTPDILNTARPIPGAGQIYSSPFQSIGEDSNTSLLQPPAIEDFTDSGSLPRECDTSAADPNEYDNTKQVRLYDPESKLWKAMLDSENPTISIGPFQQAALYSWVECSVVQACSDFLGKQQMSLRVSLLKKEVKKWRRNEVKLTEGIIKKRDRPVEFMFGMEVQCRLLEGNYKTLIFSGPSKMDPLPIITSWKQMIPSFSPRSFCIPDYIILEHLRMAERVLCLFGPGYWDKTLFEKKRSDAVKCIMNARKTQAERNEEEKIAKLRQERVEAEEELLTEVGMLSTARTSFGEFES